MLETWKIDPVHVGSDPELEMHDEIFQFEIFKNFMKILKYFKTFF